MPREESGAAEHIIIKLARPSGSTSDRLMQQTGSQQTHTRDTVADFNTVNTAGRSPDGAKMAVLGNTGLSLIRLLKCEEMDLGSSSLSSTHPSLQTLLYPLISLL